VSTGHPYFEPHWAFPGSQEQWPYASCYLIENDDVRVDCCRHVEERIYDLSSMRTARLDQSRFVVPDELLRVRRIDEMYLTLCHRGRVPTNGMCFAWMPIYRHDDHPVNAQLPSRQG